MLVKATDLLNQKVITIQDGKEVDKVKDLIYDPHENKVKALLIDKGGWFADAKVILFEDLKGVGHDVITVDSENVIRKASDVGEPVANIAKGDTHLTSTQVVTQSGIKLGSVTDLMFDPTTGLVQELEVSEGLVGNVQSGKKRVAVDKIVSIGKDATIVEAGAEQEIEQQAQTQGMQGMVNASQSKAQDIWDSTKTKAGEVKAKAEDPQTQDTFMTKANQLGETLGQKAEQAVQAAEQTLQKMGNKAQEKSQQPVDSQ